MNVTIINKNGYIVSPLEKNVDGEIKNFNMTEDYLSVDYVSSYQTVFVKPRWNGTEWVEGASEEEIQASKKENEVIQEPTIEELLIKEIANLKIEIMQLKGGNE